MLKILFHRDTLAILGIHCFGAQASEIVHIGQAIMAQKGKANTLMYFINTTFNYPTMAEAYRVAALNGPKQTPVITCRIIFRVIEQCLVKCVSGVYYYDNFHLRILDIKLYYHCCSRFIIQDWTDARYPFSYYNISALQIDHFYIMYRISNFRLYFPHD